MKSTKPIMRRKGLDIYEAPMTKAENAEIQAAMEHYINDYRDQAETFYAAYLHRQNLLVEVEDGDKRAPKRTEAQMRDLARKFSSITDNPHRKRLHDRIPSH